MYSRRRLTADFRSLGIAPGDVVMVHASVRAVGEIAGGPDEIHLALKDAITSDGTLLMYAGCPRYVDEVGRGNLSPEREAEVLEALPPFDAETARSDRSNGTLVEFFRTYPGSRVNHHVTRFVAWGKHAEYLFSRQPWSYAFGRESALDRFVELDGKILLLGSDHDTVTFLHYAEHIVDIPGKRVARFKVPVAGDGVRVWRDMEEFNTAGDGVHANWPDRFFAKITDSHLAASSNHGGRVGDAKSYLVSARGLLDCALPIMTRVAADASAANALGELPSDANVRPPRTMVFIVGPPAVGKMTVGTELARRTGLRLFHNHHTIDLVLRFFPFGSPPYSRLVREFRRRIVEEVAASDLPGLVFTFVWAFDQASDAAFVNELAQPFRDRGGRVCFVELEATQAERLLRNETAFRLSEKPFKRDVAASRRQLLADDEKYQLNSHGKFAGRADYLSMDNTDVSPVDVAKRIIEHFGLEESTT
jgi:aminoglycoside N3'-acetyltransferase